MAAPVASDALLQYVDDELLRAPLLFDQVVEGAIDAARKAMPAQMPVQRSTTSDLIQTLQAQRPRLNEYFMRSLRDQVQAELAKNPLAPAARPARAVASLALVDEDVVAQDVELSHAIEAIRSTCEHELRELQTYTSALVGDMDVARDHNPFRADTYARALGAAAQALPMSRGHQLAFLRHAVTPLAQLLRRSYAASASRLESMGVEPAAYRTVILPTGSRRGSRSSETTFSPDLMRIRATMPAPLDELIVANTGPASKPAATAATAAGPPAVTLAVTPAGAVANAAAPEPWADIARQATLPEDRQTIELVSRLFEELLADDRLPTDVAQLLSALRAPALRLTLRDPGLLDQDKHPLWRFMDRIAHEAQMSPSPADPERAQLMKTAQRTIQQVAGEPEPNTALYRWALDRMETFLQRRLARRVSAASSHVGALQKLEDKLTVGHVLPSTLHGMLDVPQLDTVPADLMEKVAQAQEPAAGAEAWLDALRPGDWVRMFLQGRWVHATLLWPGERREIWLFGDGNSDATWAIRRGALLMMYGARLAKTLKQRSLVGSAAARVHDQIMAGRKGG